MPIGVIVDALSVAIGGLLGAVIGSKLRDNFKEKMNLVLGLCSMGMGISAIFRMENMPAVVFALIIGTAIGLWIHLGGGIDRAAGFMSRAVPRRGGTVAEPEYTTMLVTAIVLFCASGTGIYGSILSGMTGDHTVLLAKAILDLFTALIFACSLGAAVSLVAVPQAIIFLVLFLLAGRIYPLCSPAMINDFKACGGFIMLATGFRMVKLKTFPIADMIPAMVLVMPISLLWVHILAALAI